MFRKGNHFLFFLTPFVTDLHSYPYLVSAVVIFFITSFMQADNFPWLGLHEYIAIIDWVLLICAIRHVINMCNYVVGGMALC